MWATTKPVVRISIRVNGERVTWWWHIKRRIWLFWRRHIKKELI